MKLFKTRKTTFTEAQLKKSLKSLTFEHTLPILGLGIYFTPPTIREMASLPIKFEVENFIERLNGSTKKK